MTNGSGEENRRLGRTAKLSALIERFAEQNAIPLDEARNLIAMFGGSQDDPTTDGPSALPEMVFG